MDAIEAASGVSIDVNYLPPNSTAPMAIMCNAGRIEIQIQSTETILIPAALHELLHLRRYLVEGEPQIGGAQKNDWELIGNLENPIEHLTIVPLQRTLWPIYHDQSKWDQSADNNWSFYVADQFNGCIYSKIQWLLLTWLETQLVEDALVKSRAENIINESGMDAVAEQFGSVALSLVGSKIDLAKHILLGLGISPQRALKQCFDRKTGKFDISNL